jgi:hypothetical protein
MIALAVRRSAVIGAQRHLQASSRHEFFTRFSPIGVTELFDRYKKGNEESIWTLKDLGSPW